MTFLLLILNRVNYVHKKAKTLSSFLNLVFDFKNSVVSKNTLLTIFRDENVVIINIFSGKYWSLMTEAVTVCVL